MGQLKRVQMLIEPRQHSALARIAQGEGRSMADVTRQVIDLGLGVLEQKDEFTQRAEALQRAKQIQDSMPLLEIDVVEDLRRMREARDEQITEGSS